MRFIIRFVDRILKRESAQKPIGRWHRDSCDMKIGRKVELSNEDHCGPCGQYRLTKIDSITNSILDNSRYAPTNISVPSQLK